MMLSIKNISDSLFTQEQKFMRDYSNSRKKCNDPYPLFSMGTSLVLYIIPIFEF